MGVKGNLRIVFRSGGGALLSHTLPPIAVGIHVDPSHTQKDPKNDDDLETGAKRELGTQTVVSIACREVYSEKNSQLNAGLFLEFVM